MNTVQTFDAGTLFPGIPAGIAIRGWSESSPYTPQKNPHYMFPSWLEDIVAWLAYGQDSLYLFGPTGCGKTSCVKQVMHALNYPVYELTGHSRLEFPDMVGHHTVHEGSMHYEYGPLPLAMKEGGLFLLNEIDLLDPSTAAGLNSILDGYPLTIAENGGELIVPHPMFRFVATANSNGGSDHTGLYQGVLRQNMAFMDRFTLVECGYMEEEEDVQLLASHAPESIDNSTLRQMIRFANAVRRLFMGYDAEDMDAAIEVTFSTRTLIRWVCLTEQYQHMGREDAISRALDRAITFRASHATRMALRELFQRIFG